MPRQEPQTFVCPICLHQWELSARSRHHLVPVSRGGARGEVENVCRVCHDQVHVLFTNQELEKMYDSMDKLLEAEPMQRWINWVRKRKPAGGLRTRTRRERRLEQGARRRR